MASSPDKIPETPPVTKEFRVLMEDYSEIVVIYSSGKTHKGNDVIRLRIQNHSPHRELTKCKFWFKG